MVPEAISFKVRIEVPGVRVSPYELIIMKSLETPK